MKLSLGLGIGTLVTSGGGSTPQIITADTAPTMSALDDSQTPADGYTAGSYSSTAGTISSAVATYLVNGSSEASSYDLSAGDTVQVSVLVTDSVGNEATFTTGTVTVTYAAPTAAGGLSDQTFQRDVAITPVDLSTDFTGDGLTYALAPSSAALPTGLSLASNGTLSGTPTALASSSAIVIRATNPEDETADSAFSLTINDVPDQMSAPTGTAASSTSISWDRAAAPAANNSAITSYDLRYSTDESTWTTVTGITDPQTVSSLTAETLYYAQTRAVNGVGAGAWSTSGTATTDAAATGTVQNQTADFGASTASGAGAYQIVDDGGDPVTNVTDAGTGTAGGYTLTSGGVISPSSSGAFSARDGETIDISCDQGTATVTLNVIASARSVANIDQLTAAAGASALGDQVLLRGGDYNQALADKRIKLATAPSGTWTGSNYVVIKPHTGETCTLHRLWLDNANGGTKYFSIEGLHLDTDTGGAATLAGVIDARNGATDFRIKGCTGGTTSHSPTAVSNLASAIYVDGTSGANMVIEDNDFDGVLDGLNVSGVNAIIQNNTVKSAYNDSLKISPPCSGILVEGFTSTDKKYSYDEFAITNMVAGNPTTITVSDASSLSVGDDCRATGFTGFDGLDDGIYDITAISGNDLTVAVNTTGSSAYGGGGTLQVSGVHGDHIQGNFSTATAGQMDDMTFRAISMTRGNGTPGWADGQGLFLSDNSSVDINNLTVEGLIYSGTFGNAVLLIRPVSSTLSGITAAGVPGIKSTSPRVYIGGGSGNTIYDALGHSFVDNADDTTTTTNCDFTIANTQAGLEAAFDAPQIDTEETIDGPTAYATKAGSAGDLASPKRGATPYQSFTSPFTYSDPRGGAATAPSAFTSGDWLAETGDAESEIDFTISSLPSDGGSVITDLEYSTDSGATWASLASTTTGIYTVDQHSDGTTGTLSADTSYTTMIRAVNGVDAGPDSDAQPVTTGAAAPSNLVPATVADFSEPAAWTAVTGMTVTGGELVINSPGSTASVANSNGYFTPVSPSTNYVGSFDVTRLGVTGKRLRFQMNYFSGGTVSDSLSLADTLPASTITINSTGTYGPYSFTTPAGCTHVRIQIMAIDTGVDLDVDNLVIEAA